MTMKLELTPEIEAGLSNQAREVGLSPEEYATQVLRERIQAVAQPTVEGVELSPEEWMREYKAWAHSHNADTFPVLSNESISRDSLYD